MRRPLRKLHNVDELRERAMRHVPRVLFDYLDGGADDELTLRANRDAYRRITFRPRVASAHPTQLSLARTVLGTALDMPVLLAPCGGTRLVFPDGDRAAARAAGRAGCAMVMSTSAATPLEQVRAATTGPLWFQLYFHGGREVSEQLVARAQAAGFGALVVTVDTAVRGNNERVKRHDATLPLAANARNAVRFAPQLLRRLRWTVGYVRDGMPTNFGASFPTDLPPASIGPAGGTWSDLAWIRDAWRGPLLVKGVLRPEDAVRAVQMGADAVVVSNHGGRQLDGTPATADVLPEIRSAVGATGSVLVDGGIRRGSDVIKALALGADAVLIGRPYLYGLAVGGEAGVTRVLTLLREGLVRDLTLLGCHGIDDIDSGLLMTGPAIGDTSAHLEPVRADAPPRDRHLGAEPEQ